MCALSESFEIEVSNHIQCHKFNTAVHIIHMYLLHIQLFIATHIINNPAGIHLAVRDIAPNMRSVGMSVTKPDTSSTIINRCSIRQTLHP